VSSFAELVATHHPSAVCADGLGALMLNVGKRCDLTCTHCHQNAGPTRTEAMTDAVYERALALALAARPALVDITGGSPELHPRLAEMVTTISSSGIEIRVRTNLVSLLSAEASGLAELFADHGVGLLASFPSADRAAFEAQRGPGTFARALEALRMLNGLGYGGGGASPTGHPLRLDLAVNPSSAAAAPAVAVARDRLRTQLASLGLAFDDVVVIANVPVGRFAEALEADGALQPYLDQLRGRFNPDVLPVLGCRCGITVSWDGSLADCDFNLGAGIPCDDDAPQTIFDVELDAAGIASIARRRIRFGTHCLACAAGSGSS
jgi:radical SAM/Cys-rich protein